MNFFLPPFFYWGDEIWFISFGPLSYSVIDNMAVNPSHNNPSTAWEEVYQRKVRTLTVRTLERGCLSITKYRTRVVVWWVYEDEKTIKNGPNGSVPIPSGAVNYFEIIVGEKLSSPKKRQGDVCRSPSIGIWVGIHSA